MNWTNPPIIKIYEALWSIADWRIELNKKQDWFFEDPIVRAKVYSSSRGKYYEVEYDAGSNAIMANDNGSYWKWYLGYPSIALLMFLWKLPVDQKFSEALKDIKWKDLNTKNNNDFDKTMEEIDSMIIEKWVNLEEFKSYLDEISSIIEKMEIKMLGQKKLPPKGY